MGYNEEEILDFNDNEEVQEEVQEEIKTKKKNKQKKDGEINPKKEFISWVFTLALAFVFAWALKTYVLINANVPTGSMENTVMEEDNLIGFRLAYQFTEPKRGDVIIFKYPDDRSQNYIKRIIGLPGDVVVIRDAEVYINGDLLEEDYIKDGRWTLRTGPYEFTVPEDSYLVLGDNRNDSRDARLWVNTYVPREDIIAKAEFIYYPFSHAGAIK